MYATSQIFHMQLASPNDRYLIEGPQGAALHTGDFRAEPWFLDALTRNPLIQQYLAPIYPTTPDDTDSVTTTLDAIYLDTACLLSEKVVPSKVG